MVSLRSEGGNRERGFEIDTLEIVDAVSERRERGGGNDRGCTSSGGVKNLLICAMTSRYDKNELQSFQIAHQFLPDQMSSDLGCGCKK